MKKKIYVYVCMECGHEWENTSEDLICPICKLANIHVEVEKDGDKDIL